MASTGNQQTIKKVNKSLLLHLIASRSPVSRVELSRITKLSPSTVSALVDELRAEDLVHETGTVSGAGAGRRMTMLAVRPDGGYVLGIDLAKPLAILLDLSGRIAAERSLPAFADKQAIIDRLPLLVEELLREHEVSPAKVRRIVVSVPGRIDEAGRRILSAVPLGLQNWALAAWLEQRIGMPVDLINDLEAAGFAERSSGAAQGCRTIVYLLVGRTVGAGLVIEDRIYRGSAGFAGRIGVFSRYGTMQLADRLKKKYPDRFPIEQEPQDTLRAFSEMALDSAGPLAEELDRVLRGISAYCGNVLQLLNPERLIIRGWIAENEAVFDRLRMYIEQAEDARGEVTPVQAAAWGDRGSAWGAATLGLHELFKPAGI